MSNKTQSETEFQLVLQDYKDKNAKLERMVRRFSATKKLQNALFQIVDVANSSKSLPVFYESLHKIVSELTSAKNFFIMLLHEENNCVSFPYYEDDEDDQQGDDDPLNNPTKQIPVSKISGSATMKVIEKRNIIHLNRQEFMKMNATGKVPEDWIGVPLILEDQLLGALVVQSYDKGFRYKRRDEDLLVYVSQHIATGIRRKQDAESLKEAHQKLQHYNLELEERVAGRTDELKQINLTLAKEVKVRRESENIQKALFKITDLVSTANNLNGLFVGVHQTISELMYAKNAYIATLSSDKNKLEFPYFIDEHDERPGTIKLHLDGVQSEQGLTATTLLSGESQLHNISTSSSRQKIGPSAVSWLGVPLKDRNETFGVLVVQSYDKANVYNKRHLLLLETVAHQISNAILRKKDTDALIRAHENLERRVKERTSVLEETIINRRKIEKRLEHESLHDALTQLPNRRYLQEELDSVLQGKMTGKSNDIALLFLDLDRFKIINDSLGHHVGDLFLIEVARRLKSCMRSDDLVARLGGDEFCILMPNIQKESAAFRLCGRILNELKRPVEVANNSLITSASIGVRLANHSEKSADLIMSDADAAMYQAKHQGKNRFCVFDAEIKRLVTGRMKMERDLRDAIDNNELFLVYQPIVNFRTNQVVGFEALVRWTHPQDGLISPVEFIPVAEETGLIVDIGELVIDMACKTLSKFKENSLLEKLYLNVNVSSVQILSRTLDDFIRHKLIDFNLDTNKLNVEITESILIDDYKAALSFVRELKSMGIKIYLDDFGTGFSSLSYLHKFPFDAIKLDRSFITALDENENNEAIVDSIAQLAKNLNLHIVAEGIETQHQLDTIKKMDYEVVQGYFFSKPIEYKKINRYIESWV